MRTISFSPVLFGLVFCSSAWAQDPGMQFGAGLGYARMFDAGGVSFTAAVDRPVAPQSGKLRHAVGGTFWYAHTDIASNPADPQGREILGVGVRYSLGFGPTGLFLALPVQLLHSSVPDRPILDASTGRHGIPEPPPEPPAEDRLGSAWGWGAGLELGFRVALAAQLSAQTSVQGLYQDIYAESRDHGAWNWHAGLTYHFSAE